MRLSMKVNDTKIDCSIEEELYIDFDRLDKAVQEHSSMLAWWYAVLAEKEEEMNNISVLADSKIAQRELEVRNILVSKNDAEIQSLGVNSDVKVTEGVISAILAADDLIRKYKKRVNQVKKEFKQLKAMCSGFEARTGLLTSAYGRRRAELEAQLKALTSKTTNEAKKES